MRNSKTVKAFCLVLALVVLCSCSKWYGINRHLKLTHIPQAPTGCVKAALLSVDSVKIENESIRNGEYTSAEDKSQRRWATEEYTYSVEGITANLRVTIYRDDNEYFFGNSYSSSLSEIDQANADRIRPVMVAIEKKVAAKCDVPSIESEIEEYCSEVKCRPLGKDKFIKEFND